MPSNMNMFGNDGIVLGVEFNRSGRRPVMCLTAPARSGGRGPPDTSDVVQPESRGPRGYGAVRT